MKFTRRDLRAPHECFQDKCETFQLSRGDIALLNQIIALLNLTAKDEKYNQFTAQISLILESEKITPGAASLIFKVPGMFRKHIIEFSEEMAAKQQEYYGKHPDQKPLNPMMRFLSREEIKSNQEQEGSADSADPQGVDAESTQQVEHRNIESQPE